MYRSHKKPSLTHGISIALLAIAFPLSRQIFAAEPTQPQTEVEELPAVQVSADQTTEEGAAQTGYRNKTTTLGPLGKTTLQDIPYSVNVTSSELFSNRGAHTVSDALKTNPTVTTLMESSAYSTLSRVMIRGFTAADQGDLRDGLVDRSFTFVPLENVERIEVFNGLSSFLYGFSAMGGTLNYVSKAPLSERMASIATGTYGGGINYLHADAGGPISANGCWTYRGNAYTEDGDTYIDGGTQKRSLLSMAANCRISADTTFHTDIWHQELEMRGIQTYINVNPSGGIRVPSASEFNASTQYGQDWTYNKSNKTLLGFGLDSRLSDGLTLRTAYRYGDMWRAYEYVSATLSDNSGNYTEKAYGTTGQKERTQSAYTLMDATFPTGPVEHKVTYGFTGTEYLYTRGDDVSRTLGSSNIDSPTSYSEPSLSIGPTNVWYQQYYTSLVLGDQIKLSDKWSALAGLNRSEIRQKRWGTGSSLATPNYAQEKSSPSYALMYKPTPTVTTYVSYMEGLANGGTAPSTASNANEILPASVSSQYEAGTKASIGSVDLTAAVFRINKINEYTDPTDNVYKQDGREIHKGLEFTASGKILGRLTAVGGFTVLNAKVTQARNNTAIEGKSPANIPRQQVRLYLEYATATIPGLTVNSGASYSARRPVDATNTDYMAGSTIYDIGARYQTQVYSRRLTFNLNINNLFNTAYWSYYRSGDGLLLGAPRTISLSARIDL
jgi:iron complex outermembrane recepter protein